MSAWTDPAAVAAFLSAVAAIAAGVATWRGPMAAAKMAETLRRAAESATDNRRFKLNVFSQIMQERAEIYSAEGVKALNSIDVAFSDTPEVREAWSELYNAFNASPISPSHVLDERLRKLLREMANSLGIGDKLRIDDFGRVYYPNALRDESRWRELERTAALEKLTGQPSPAANVTAGEAQVASLFPPKPQ